MSADGLTAAQEKMRSAGVSPAAIEVFSHYYKLLAEGATGLIPEASIDPLTDPPMLEDVQVSSEEARAALAKTVIIKLNGGLGTSMGLAEAKSLLPVRDGNSFLDLIVKQVLAARKRYGIELPLLFMNSFRTQGDTLAVLAKYPDLPVGDIGLDFVQNQEPKLTADDLQPVTWPEDPELEWCPPGHGDLYTALEDSGVLERLLAAGYRYASVSNGDNLGASPNARIAGWFAASGAPYAAEVCHRTANDRKGGHLAIRKSDGQLILRDTAQTAADEMRYFTDEYRHPFFHANNLWFDLQVLADTLAEHGAVLGLPLIRNEKTVDPADKASTEVIQIETAMGAAIEVFPGATAICVGRDRFVPVKTTNELLLLRSDTYLLDEDYHLVSQTDSLPEISLDPKYYKLVSDFEQRIPEPLSLREATRLQVEGDWTFGAGVSVVGDVHLSAQSAPGNVPDGTSLGGADAGTPPE